MEVATSIEVNCLKTDLFNVNKEVEITRVSIQKLQEGKGRLEELEEVIEEYKSSEDFLDDITEGLLSAFHEIFKDCKNKVKEIFPDINVTLLIPSIRRSAEEEARKV